MKLSDFAVLSFDCYGTLIDWETGIHQALGPLLSQADAEPSRDSVLEAFARLESRRQAEKPGMLYPDLLADVHAQLAAQWNVPPNAEQSAAFGRSIANWPAFPDTVEALRYLKRHFKLSILSNIDRVSFQASNARLGVEFDAIYTAQDIGSYKPDRRNFRYLLDRLAEQGFPRQKLLHVAQSLFHDHVPAKALGLNTAWIDRRAGTGWGATAPVAGNVQADFHFPSLGSLADRHRAGG